MQSDTTISITPNKAFFKPGEIAVFQVAAPQGTRAEATITHLAEVVATLPVTLEAGAGEITWSPPLDAPRGYGLTLDVYDGATHVATTAIAFDVLDNWLQAPRYGFLSEFKEGRANTAETIATLARYHVNGLQFYDWQYRHESLLPVTDIYTDLLGREMSMTTVTTLIDAAHERNIAAMPYTAIYGASPAFYQLHQDWAMYQANGRPFEFGSGLLYIMDPSQQSPWNTHLLGEFARVLADTDFDGIHIDQYGAPQTGLNAAGERVDLAEVFPAFINQTAELVEEQRGEAGAVIFNAVRNWPVDTVAPANQDVVYIEVWNPYRNFMDLHRQIVRAQELGGNKPVILAAYIHPEQVYNVRLANAVIFASGGYHLELGELDAMLADPYFPKFGVMDSAMQDIMHRTYDFLVRYEEVLSLDTTDGTADRSEALTIEGIKTRSLRSKDRVAVIVREGQDFETFSLVNMMGLDSGEWNMPLTHGPDALSDLAVQIRVERPVAQVWWASPDRDSAATQPLTFTAEQDADGALITVEVPYLDYWSMIVVEYQS